MKFSDSYTENQDKSIERGKDDSGNRQITYQLMAGVLSQEPVPGIAWCPHRSTCSIYCYHPHQAASLFFLQGRGEKEKKPLWILNTSLPNSHILLTKVRKRRSANINTSDISVLHFPILQVPIHEQTPSSSCFPNERHERASPGIQTNQKIKPGFWFPRYNPEIQ